MKKEIQTLNDIIKHHNQYTDDSLLWKTIQRVFNDLYEDKDSKVKVKCSEKQAKKRAKEYCNVISFYALCYVTGKINITLYEFIKDGLRTGFIGYRFKRNGFIKWSKNKILNIYGADLDMVYYEKPMTYEEIFNFGVLKDGFYQMKIKSRAGGYHFIAAYMQDKILYISDTSNRGVGVYAKDYIDKNQFIWLLDMGE